MRAHHITVSTPCPNLAGCGLLTDGRLNPFNCFGQSEPREPPIEQTVANTARSSKVSLAVYVSGIKLNSVRQIAVLGTNNAWSSRR